MLMIVSNNENYNDITYNIDIIIPSPM